MAHSSTTAAITRSRVAIVACLAIAVFLVTEHGAHLLGVLPYLLLLACPVMHLLHRGRHEADRYAASVGSPR